MKTGKEKHILRGFVCVLLIMIALGCSVVSANGDDNTMALSVASCYGTENLTGNTFSGKAVDYRNLDVFTLLGLSPAETWNKSDRGNKTIFENSNDDSLFVTKGRMVYSIGNSSKDADELFAQQLSMLYCANNNQIFNKELYDLSYDRSKGIAIDTIENKNVQKNSRNAIGLLKKLVQDQEPYLLQIFEETANGKDYTLLVFGFMVNGVPVYGYNEATIGIVNPDETETAVRELATAIYSQDGLACLEVDQIMSLEEVGESPLIPFEKARDILSEWILILPDTGYTVHQSWLSEVPLGDFSREPLTFTPFWNFFLTWEEDGETWCATPRINAITGEMLWW